MCVRYYIVIYIYTVYIISYCIYVNIDSPAALVIMVQRLQPTSFTSQVTPCRSLRRSDRPSHTDSPPASRLLAHGNGPKDTSQATFSWTFDDFYCFPMVFFDVQAKSPGLALFQQLVRSLQRYFFSSPTDIVFRKMTLYIVSFIIYIYTVYTSYTLYLYI